MGSTLEAGPYRVAFDKQGATIIHGTSGARYRVDAPTATTTAQLIRCHLDVCLAMLGRHRECLEAYKMCIKGKLYPVGYAAQGAMQRVEALMSDHSAHLLDARLAPFSRWRPAWNKKALQERWGARYTHERRLGNVNYRAPGEPIRLLDPDAGIRTIVELLQQDRSVILLCACKDYETCHRHTIVDLVVTILPDVEVVL